MIVSLSRRPPFYEDLPDGSDGVGDALTLDIRSGTVDATYHTSAQGHLNIELLDSRFTHGKVVTRVDGGDKTQRSDQGSSAVPVGDNISPRANSGGITTYEMISP